MGVLDKRTQQRDLICRSHLKTEKELKYYLRLCNVLDNQSMASSKPSPFLAEVLNI